MLCVWGDPNLNIGQGGFVRATLITSSGKRAEPHRTTARMRLLCFGHTQVSEQNNKRGDAPSFPSPTCLGDTSTGALPSSMEWRVFPTRQVVSQKGFVHLARFVEGQWFQVGLTGSEYTLTFLKHVPPSTPLLCCFIFASFLWLHLTRKLLTPRNSCGESWSGPSGATPRPLSRTRRRTILWRLKPSVGSALPNVKPPKPGMVVFRLRPQTKGLEPVCS